ncbi:hypothetical protein BS17DRAFT_526797 [Gyrodon lividus]|nr:hypothetical protein BS17DRAFT_526797 [Gyrodon lividus]
MRPCKEAERDIGHQPRGCSIARVWPVTRIKEVASFLSFLFTFDRFRASLTPPTRDFLSGRWATNWPVFSGAAILGTTLLFTMKLCGRRIN